MPIFVCEKCGAIENTALGHFWGKAHFRFKDANLNGKALCSRCVPIQFISGAKTGYNGEWHNKFPFEIYDPVKHKDWDIINK